LEIKLGNVEDGEGAKNTILSAIDGCANNVDERKKIKIGYECVCVRERKRERE